MLHFNRNRAFAMLLLRFFLVLSSMDLSNRMYVGIKFHAFELFLGCVVSRAFRAVGRKPCRTVVQTRGRTKQTTASKEGTVIADHEQTLSADSQLIYRSAN